MNFLPINSPAPDRISRRTAIKVAAVGLLGSAVGGAAAERDAAEGTLQPKK